MTWWRAKQRDSESAQPSSEQVAQYERVEREYREVRANRPQIDRTISSLRGHYEANGFAWRVALAMQETRRR